MLGVSPKPGTVARRDIQDCVALQMVSEAVRCLEDGILRSPRDGDIGAVMGLGFPPFRGGPFRWIDQQGAAAVADRLRSLAKEHGTRFEPAPMLAELADREERFHP